MKCQTIKYMGPYVFSQANTWVKTKIYLHRHCSSVFLMTSFLCAPFQGMSISVVGPTFEDLASNVNQDISNISYIFVGRASGYIGGSLFGGILFDHLNPHLMLGEIIIYLENSVVNVG